MGIKSATYALEHEHTPEKMMEDLLGDMDMKIYEKVPTQFHCNLFQRESRKSDFCWEKDSEHDR